MKFKLNLHERLIFLSLLPKQNDFSTMKILRKVSQDVGFTDEEYKYYNIKPVENGRISFDVIKAQEEKDFDIGEIAVQLVKTALEKLDKDKKLTQEHFSIYEKFVN